MAAKTARRKEWRGLALAFVLALAGCTAVPPENSHAYLPLPHPAQAEIQPGLQHENDRILASYGGVYKNARLQTMLEVLVKRLVAASERPNLQYRVIMLNSPAINAFALPDGHLYITRGLIALANDESELASVIGHEMGHVIARHAQIREEQARQAALVDQVFTDVLDDPQTGALAIAKSKLALASFSRQQEFEADAIGVGISARAGFDPFGAARFLIDMQRKANLKSGNSERQSRTIGFLSTHPSTPARVMKVLANARRYSGPGVGERDRPQYLADLSGMIYGEDPSEGFVHGRRFLHPRLGFTFLAPPSFTLDNTAHAVLGVKGGGEAMRLDVVSVPAEQSLSDYLKSGWIENVDPRSIESFMVNGFPAAAATAAGKNWSFRLYAVRFGSDVYRFIFAAKSMTPQIDQSFRRSVATFRRMSLKESAAIKPQHLTIVTVGARDTVASLAHHMAVSDHKIKRFRVLNGLSPKARLKRGQKVKIVE